jgi:hypothetical protein
MFCPCSCTGRIPVLQYRDSGRSGRILRLLTIEKRDMMRETWRVGELKRME